MVCVCGQYEEVEETDSNGVIIDVKIKCGEACGGTMIADCSKVHPNCCSLPGKSNHWQ